MGDKLDQQGGKHAQWTTKQHKQCVAKLVKSNGSSTIPEAQLHPHAMPCRFGSIGLMFAALCRLFS